MIRGEDIVAVGPDAQLRSQWSAARQIDAKGKYLIPGLWDMHVHFGGGPALIEENKALLPLYIAHGITTVRDCSGDLPEQVLQWRGEIAKGTLFGPRLLSSGAKIEGIKPVWKGTIEVGSEADADKAITRLQHDKVDFVKITDSTLKPELFLYSASAARKAGFKASGHIPMALTVEQAVDAGLASIEHLDYAFKAGSKDEAQIAADFGAGRIDAADRPGCSRARRTHYLIAQRAENFMRLNLRRNIYMNEICDAAGVSERGLRYAFEDLFGTSPNRYLSMLRLCAACRSLSMADSSRRSVKAIALSCGLWDLSRFADNYRKVFGELPRDTLMRAPAQIGQPA